jgi:hypothetical protein
LVVGRGAGLGAAQRSGPRGKKGGEREWAARERKGSAQEGEQAGLLGSFPFFFFSNPFHTQTIQTILFEFK